MYDSILNSVFESMILRPLLAKIENSSNLEITLVSFEKAKIPAQKIKECIPAHDKFHLIICPRLPFFGKLSLRFASWQLKKILQKIPSHQIISRGPLAGWVTMRALNTTAKKMPERLRTGHPNPIPLLMVQARGLAAEEFRFVKERKERGFIRRRLDTYLQKQLHQIEFEVYRNKRKTDYPHDVDIQAVSPALKSYLINIFRADPAKITIATDDIPKYIEPEQRRKWRKQIREKLSIPPDAYVYGYAGSTRIWQGIAEMTFYFQEIVKKNPESFLLILSNEKKEFTSFLTQTSIPKNKYSICDIPAHAVYRYLSACDAGLLFRQQDIINWVARPTKMLEYQAVGLKIIHNNTIAWLTQVPQK
jgi:hypothetical protein